MAQSRRRIPTHILQCRELKDAIRLYYLLSEYGFKTGQCWPHQDTLAQELGVARKTVQRWLKLLVERRFVIVQRTLTGNIYSLPDHMPGDGCSAMPSVDHRPERKETPPPLPAPELPFPTDSDTPVSVPSTASCLSHVEASSRVSCLHETEVENNNKQDASVVVASRPSEQERKTVLTEEESVAVQRSIDLGVGRTTATELVQSFGEKAVTQALDYTEQEAKKSRIRSLPGFFRYALREGLRPITPPKPVNRVGPFFGQWHSPPPPKGEPAPPGTLRRLMREAEERERAEREAIAGSGAVVSRLVSELAQGFSLE